MDIHFCSIVSVLVLMSVILFPLRIQPNISGSIVRAYMFEQRAVGAHIHDGLHLDHHKFVHFGIVIAIHSAIQRLVSRRKRRVRVTLYRHRHRLCSHSLCCSGRATMLTQRGE